MKINCPFCCIRWALFLSFASFTHSARFCLLLRQSDDMDEDESEQEDSSVHSSSIRSDSSGRVKKNKRGRPAKKKKKSKDGAAGKTKTT